MTFVVYEIAGKKPSIKEIGTVRATTSEAARRKAIIGTNIEFNDTVAATYSQHK